MSQIKRTKNVHTLNDVDDKSTSKPEPELDFSSFTASGTKSAWGGSNFPSTTATVVVPNTAAYRPRVTTTSGKALGKPSTRGGRGRGKTVTTTPNENRFAEEVIEVSDDDDNDEDVNGVAREFEAGTFFGDSEDAGYDDNFGVGNIVIGCMKSSKRFQDGVPRIGTLFKDEKFYESVPMQNMFSVALKRVDPKTKKPIEGAPLRVTIVRKVEKIASGLRYNPKHNVNSGNISRAEFDVFAAHDNIHYFTRGKFKKAYTLSILLQAFNNLFPLPEGLTMKMVMDDKRHSLHRYIFKAKGPDGKKAKFILLDALPLGVLMVEDWTRISGTVGLAKNKDDIWGTKMEFLGAYSTLFDYVTQLRCSNIDHDCNIAVHIASQIPQSANANPNFTVDNKAEINQLTAEKTALQAELAAAKQLIARYEADYKASPPPPNQQRDDYILQLQTMVNEFAPKQKLLDEFIVQNNGIARRAAKMMVNKPDSIPTFNSLFEAKECGLFWKICNQVKTEFAVPFNPFTVKKETAAASANSIPLPALERVSRPVPNSAASATISDIDLVDASHLRPAAAPKPPVNAVPPNPNPYASAMPPQTPSSTAASNPMVMASPHINAMPQAYAMPAMPPGIKPRRQ